MPIRQITSVDMLNETIEQNPQVLVDFYSAWCGPCQMLHPVLEAIDARANDSLVIARIDTDENPDLAEEYDVQSIPLLILFIEGKIALRAQGYRDEETLMALIEKARAKHAAKKDQTEAEA